MAALPIFSSLGCYQNAHSLSCRQCPRCRLDAGNGPVVGVAHLADVNMVEADLLVRYPWARIVSCPREGCPMSWFVCCSCTGSYLMQSSNQLYGHHRRSHLQDHLLAEQPPPAEFELAEPRALDYDHPQPDTVPASPTPPRPANRNRLRWVRDVNPYHLCSILTSVSPKADDLRYLFDGPHPPEHGHTPVSVGGVSRSNFFRRQSESPGGGILFLVRSLFRQRLSLLELQEMTLSWCVFLFLLAQVLFRQPSGSLRNDVCALLHALACQLGAPVSILSTIPLTADVADRDYVGPRKSSLVSSLPRPDVITTEDGQHAYVSFSQSLQLLSGHGTGLEPLHVIDMHGGIVYSSSALHARTARGVELLKLSLQSLGYLALDEAPVPLFESDQTAATTALPHSHPVAVYEFLLWSDAFDAASTKMNRGSTWVCFASVGMPSNAYHSSRNTFLVGVGPSRKGVSHDGVFSLLGDEIRAASVRNGLVVFHAQSVTAHRAHVWPYAVLQDSPERSASSCILGFRGKRTTMFGHLCSFESVQDSLVSCPPCHASNLRGQSHTLCEHCLNWKPPTRPLRYVGMQQACLDTYESLKKRAITRAAALSFLKENGVAPEHGNKVVAAGVAASNQRVAAPESVLLPPAPAMWDFPGCDVQDSVEVPMHMLFLGIAKSFAKDSLHGFLRGRKLWSSFVDGVNPLLRSLQGLNLPWLKPFPISTNGTFGGWVSENFLAYARIMKHLTSVVPSLAATDTVYADPHVPPDKMTVKMMRAWLRARGMKATLPEGQPRLRRNDYLSAIQSTGWTKPGDHPPIPKNHTEGTTSHTFMCASTSCHLMISLIMGVDCIPSDGLLTEIECAIRLYLTYDDALLRSDRSPAHPNGDGTPPTATVVTHHRGNSRRRSSQLPSHTAFPHPAEEADDNSEDGDLVLGADEEDRVDEEVVPGNGSLLVSCPGTAATARLPALEKRNKINLLKIPEQLRYYGSWRQLTELGAHGEASVRTVKPIIRRIQGMSRKNWAANTATGWTANCALAAVCEAAKESLGNCRGGPEAAGETAIRFVDSLRMSGSIDEQATNNTTPPPLQETVLYFQTVGTLS